MHNRWKNKLLILLLLILINIYLFYIFSFYSINNGMIEFNIDEFSWSPAILGTIISIEIVIISSIIYDVKLSNSDMSYKLFRILKKYCENIINSKWHYFILIIGVVIIATFVNKTIDMINIVDLPTHKMNIPNILITFLVIDFALTVIANNRNKNKLECIDWDLYLLVIRTVTNLEYIFNKKINLNSNKDKRSISNINAIKKYKEFKFINKMGYCTIISNNNLFRTTIVNLDKEIREIISTNISILDDEVFKILHKIKCDISRYDWSYIEVLINEIDDELMKIFIERLIEDLIELKKPWENRYYEEKYSLEKDIINKNKYELIESLRVLRLSKGYSLEEMLYKIEGKQNLDKMNRKDIIKLEVKYRLIEDGMLNCDTETKDKIEILFDKTIFEKVSK